ncbi:ABC transporter ATP-binding protein [Halocella sp. SP3-1]|uniref:ABC transporter ATP-binding protein n=1 Tax=Halocella sp. SP3-1 TaxID=2382161 RepID=UPI000F753C91|nr:ABC transporter ATP-binding protein [Halocella sp. SP3-1]AZO93496.1 ABC transporter ATP-binding protein [Halocella sp. SP3-1]
MEILKTVNLSKKFGDIVANNNINFSIKKGEIHAVVGENGAGKSTLMNLIYGLHQPSSGEIYVSGQRREIANPRVAISLGIGMVHQEFKLISSLTVLENILLGVEPRKNRYFFDDEKAIEEIRALDKKYSLEIDPFAVICDLSVGIQQRVEILKMLYREVDILILDEPTAVLTPQEIDGFLQSLKNLKKRGKSIIFVTHKLEEVLQVSDRVTVMRGGEKIKTLITEETDKRELANLMVGRDILLDVNIGDFNPGRTVLETKGLETYDKRGIKKLDGLSFKVRRGEIVGIAGVQGNGQEELLRVLTGMQEATAGKVIINGQDISNLKPAEIREKGVANIPSDRFGCGLAAEGTVSENLICGYHHRKSFKTGKFLSLKKIKNYAEDLIEKYNIKTVGVESKVGSLSGGNAQKVIIARELAFRPNVLIASQPTRGLDIGAIDFVHEQLLKARSQGIGIILISTELEEILSLSDRILVLYEGKIVGSLRADEAEKEKLGILMTGEKDCSENKMVARF